MFRWRPSGSQPPFGLGIALSVPLQLGIRLLRIPLPAVHSAFLAVGLLRESATGLPCSAFVKYDQ
jgi:hypothetical protein